MLLYHTKCQQVLVSVSRGLGRHVKLLGGGVRMCSSLHMDARRAYPNRLAPVPLPFLKYEFDIFFKKKNLQALC